jgi:RimJ/RimL family protein N-acetyltransferase
MKVSDSVFLPGETIDLCIPTREDLEDGGWFRWFNDPKTTKFLGGEGIYPNTGEAQTRRFENLISDLTRVVLLIRPKGGDRPIGLVSLTHIDYRMRRADINLVKGVRTQDHRLYALEAMARMTEHGFERVGLIVIVGAQVWPGLRNWQQRLELLGYRCEGILRKSWSKGYHECGHAYITCLLEDYRELKSLRSGEFWPGESRMRELIAELPKTSCGTVVESAIRKAQEDYFAKLRQA